MPLGRRIAASVLLASILAGGLLAPVTHLVWMQIQGETSRPMHRDHVGSREKTRAVPVADSGKASLGEQGTPPCPYLKLLTSLSPADAPSSPSVDHEQGSASLAVAIYDSPAGPSRINGEPRGPPTAVSEPA